MRPATSGRITTDSSDRSEPTAVIPCANCEVLTVAASTTVALPAETSGLAAAMAVPAGPAGAADWFFPYQNALKPTRKTSAIAPAICQSEKGEDGKPEAGEPGKGKSFFIGERIILASLSTISEVGAQRTISSEQPQENLIFGNCTFYAEST